MRQSETLSELFAAFSIAQGKFSGAPKDSVNPHFKNKYADLASIVSVIREPFAENGLSFFQLVTVGDKVVSVETILAHKSGEFLAETLDLPLLQVNPQGVGSTVTYGRRYGLMAMIGVAPEDDDDGNKGSQTPATDQRDTTQRQEPGRDRVKEADEAAANVRAYIESCKKEWATKTSQTEMGAWWRAHTEDFNVRFSGKEDPLYVEFKAAFTEAGNKLPVEPPKGAEKPADKPKDDIPEFKGDARPSESSIRMAFEAALQRTVNHGDCNEAFIKFVEPYEKSLSKPFVDEMYELLRGRQKLVQE